MKKFNESISYISQDINIEKKGTLVKNGINSKKKNSVYLTTCKKLRLKK